jgi:hypothetical protein
MKNRPNYYRLLQIQPDALPEIINASYRIMMRELKKHPDLGGSTEEAALLNEAREVLSDPSKRAAYDDELFLEFIHAPRSHLKKPAPLAFCLICKSPLSQVQAPGGTCPVCRTPVISGRLPEAGQPKGRSIERVKIADPIYYHSSWPGEARKGRMIDFSPRGVRFVAKEALMTGTVLKISCTLFQASGKITNVCEEIIDGKQCYSVGVYFLAVHFDDPCGTFLSTSA